MNDTLGGLLSTQAPMLAALARLAQTHPDLPGAYLTTSDITPGEAHALLDHPSDVEAWREALHMDSTDVAITTRKDQTKLGFTVPLGSISLHVYALFPLATQVVTA
ncbi:hypothetical protein [Streptomyces sp. NBC_00122]|uniref:hypothetical protein n=1 Tax=Streptomyces sp. NBC_00122 TaxID=2903623 RepID=UPI003243E7E1